MGTPPTPPVGVGGGFGGRGAPPGVDITEALAAVRGFAVAGGGGGVKGAGLFSCAVTFSALIILTGTSSKPPLSVPLFNGVWLKPAPPPADTAAP